MSASGRRSSTPVTVTRGETFQFGGVKVMLERERVPSAVLELLRAKVTLAAGWLARTTRKVAVAPVSRVRRPVVGVMRTAATSSSALAAATSVGLRAL